MVNVMRMYDEEITVTLSPENNEELHAVLSVRVAELVERIAKYGKEEYENDLIKCNAVYASIYGFNTYHYDLYMKEVNHA